MNTQTTLTLHESQLLTSQTGLLLLLLGNLLAQESIACTRAPERACQTLFRLGRMLIEAGKCEQSA